MVLSNNKGAYGHVAFRWDPENGFSGVIVRIPEKALAFVALANSEAIWWHNSLVKGEIEKSPIAKAFISEALAR
ncbi:hypothetical protein Q4520_19995 [Alteromonas sp. 1_MG-2023]|uniref:hypothetical protein n=1 Tax=Alteromonas sp. 1_MG-2023 TaxID=3062669 RepID=UPI0026E11BE4|nr:hypothetical protein [Alteromonas sp. 1_MG-2023]MDO6477713.1 hypothetical protein [Alteromonas sp. 1_MG-2023]